MNHSILLEKLNEGIEGVSTGFGGIMYEALLVCLNSQNHNSGIALPITTNSEISTFTIDWAGQIDENIIRSHKDKNRTTDYGAMGLSVLLALKLTDYTGYTTSQKGDGVDFWLETEDEMFAARLEISGIMEETKSNSVEKRLKIKLKQTNQSDKSFTPAFVSIIEFKKPMGVFLRK
jgi:hypothetical protein